MPEPLLPVAITAQVQGRRGQAVPGAGPAGRRGPDAAAGEQRRDPPAGAVVHGRGPRRRAARPAQQPVRRGRGDRPAAGAAAGDVRRQGAGPGPARQAVRRARPVRHLRHRGRAAAVRQRLRVRRQGRRRRGAAAVHPVGGEGRPGPDGARRAGRLPDGRHPGHAGRRQGALGRLLRHGVPEGRPGCPAGRGEQVPGRCCWSRSTRCPCWSPTTTSARSCPTCPRGAAGCSAPSRSADGRTLVKAEVPELEITSYAIDLRSMSHGTGSFTRSYLRYEPMPSHLADKVAAESKPG